jgi:2OG-Fe(II) oxygenase superfamily
VSTDFIEIFENALAPEVCREICARFDAGGAFTPGRVGSGVFPDLKKSMDLTISGMADWKDIEGQLNAAVISGFRSYLRKYPYTLIAPLMIEHQSHVGAPRTRMSDEHLRHAPELQLNQLIMSCFRPGSINVQRYTANQGGYPYWHCEVYPRDPACESLHRTLLWTIYLNDSFEEGETEFLYQDRKIQPKTGSLLIAPGAFTHTHRGNMPKGGDKYIATSWILFQRSEAIFGSAGKA